jgi:hypothetical protein
MAQVTREQAEALIDQYIVKIGLTKEQTYNSVRRAWYWNRGSAKIEVFVQEVNFGTFSRYYLRVFSPILKVAPGSELKVYKRLLELNDTNLGLKLTLLPNSDQVYATFERDINGIDFEELSTTIADLEWWADKLDDELIAEFSNNIVSDRQ